ncbi:MAG: acyl-CoA reductase [Bacteroidales bacterium]
MNISERSNAFIELGNVLAKKCDTLSDAEFIAVITKAEQKNPWFTYNNIITALSEIADMLHKNEVHQWIAQYSFSAHQPKRVAVIMAGNIPAVGFHDALCVLISGNYLIAKTSSKDSVLIPYILKLLSEIEPAFASQYEICTELLPSFDAVICTGSNNSSRYFKYYFGKYPHIIRKNRTSVGVVVPEDSAKEYTGIGSDVFSYFGLGCRNISKLYIHESIDVTKILDEFMQFNSLQSHNKYMNNYEYNRSVYLLNQIEHLDTGFMILKEDTQLHSPLGVLFYETYSDISTVQHQITTVANELQCIACSQNIFLEPHTVEPGKTQQPRISEYADNVDTLNFLLNI